MSKIAYSSQGLLYVIDLESGEITRFDQTKGMWNPAWSPDGAWIAFGWQEINLLEVATGNIRELVLGGSFPAFHHRDETLLYNVSGRGLYAHHLPSDTITKIIGNTLQPFQATWHPDGDHIAFVGEEGVNHFIFTLDLACLDAGNCEQSTHQMTRLERYNHAPAWSPDGKTLAFEHQDQTTGNWGIMLVDADGGNVRRISPPDVSDHHPSWSPDGNALVIERESDHAGIRANLYIIDLEGKTLRQITTTGGTEPHWLMTEDIPAN